MQGIYAIVNTGNGKRYIGSAGHIRKRWEMHRHHLRLGSHHCAHLQRAWAKHGADAFRWEVLEEVQDVSALLEREQWWIEYYRAMPEGIYNARVIASSNRGYAQPAEVREKHRSTWLGKHHSPESREKISRAKRGEVRSEAFKQTLREYHTGRKRPASVGAAISAAKSGKPLSEAHRQALRAAKLGRPWSDARRAAHRKKAED